MRMKIHEREGARIVALCDAGLLGKVLRSGELMLDLEKHADFYNGGNVGEKEAVAALASASSANLVGKKSVEAGKKAKIITGKEVVMIGGVPHCQAYRL
jgi:hypothetical protein